MNDAALIEVVRRRIAAGKPVRRTLPGGGRLHVDRALPFLCVYRRPADRADVGTAELVRTQASYLILPAADTEEHTALLAGVVASLVDACGACLVLELGAGDAAASTAPPTFRIHAAAGDRLATTVGALADALRTMTSSGAAVAAEVVSLNGVAPPGRAPLLDAKLAARSGVLALGVEVPPLYRSGETLYPMVFRAIARDLMQALHRAFFEFTRVQTPLRPEHFHAMGRRRVVQAVRASDLGLCDISASFDFLLAITPVNAEEAWLEFAAGGRTVAPTLRYRMLAVDPEQGKRLLYQLPFERLEDPVLAQLLRAKRQELDRQLGLLEDRDTPRFLYGSLQLYPPVDDGLFAEALAILRALPAARLADTTSGARLDATAFAARAEAELAYYRERLPTFGTRVHIRDDLASLLVSNGDLLVPRRLDVAAGRVDALLQHEVGTHAVTYANGCRQPLRVLAAGLAGYEALQEGLAMFAEYLAGGLDGERLRLIAARVVAVRRLVEGVTFPALVAELTEQHGLAPRPAFSVALRVFRGGGLSKDAIYLRGLLQVLEHLRGGGGLDALLVGKLAYEQIGLIEELVRREILHPPSLSPRWLDHDSAGLARARRGLRPLDLVLTGVPS